MELDFTRPRCPSFSEAAPSVAEVERIYSLFSKRCKFQFMRIDCLRAFLRIFSFASANQAWQLLGSEHEEASQQPLRVGVDRV